MELCRQGQYSECAGQYSLLALLILIFMLGFAALEFRNNEVFKQSLLLQQKARETQILEQIRASLLGFSANQGLHSQSHLGLLPMFSFMSMN